jgi:hypothetical protein
VGDFGCPLISKFVEEHTQRSLATAGTGPYEAAGVVIYNNDQVAVPTFVRDLIDTDPPQTVKTINNGFDIIVDSGDDRPDSPPRNP